MEDEMETTGTLYADLVLWCVFFCSEDHYLDNRSLNGLLKIYKAARHVVSSYSKPIP